MTKYLFIESRDPHNSADSPHFSDLVNKRSATRKTP